MDLIRSSIKVLFYDFSVEAVAEIISKGLFDSRGHLGDWLKDIDDDFLDRFSEGLKWREDKFTSSEINILLDWVKDELLTDQDTDFDIKNEGQYTLYEKVFVSLPKIGDRLLNLDGRMPTIKFSNLLRWRDLTLLTGEDLITLASLARKDIDVGKERADFCWPNILGHDNVIINHILSNALSDTHAHLWASTDVFEFNWLVAMNHPEIIATLDEEKKPFDFLSTGKRQYYDRIARYSSFNISLGCWIVVAAFLRIRIFLYIKDSQLIDVAEAANLKLTDFRSADIQGFLDEFQGYLKEVKKEALPLAGNLSDIEPIYFDYAIDKDMAKDEKDIKSPYMVLAGERRLFYRFFFKYFSRNNKECKPLAKIVYLYWLIKIKVRREFVQTNGLRGFKNFQVYNNIKSKFVNILSKKNKDKVDLLKQASIKFAIQSSIVRSKHNNNFEVRVCLNNVNLVGSCDFAKPIFSGSDFNIGGKEHLTLVVHFIKTADKDKHEDGELRNKELREDLKNQLDEIRFLLKNDQLLPIVGFDAAGNELNANPDVFAPTFRELRKMGFLNLTYHVGEDFYDLVHGLRSVDEAINFLNLTTGCRIGHGLALGVDARNYYQQRHHYAIMPNQVALDNIVWIRYTAMRGNIPLMPETELFIEEQFARLSEELGYEQCAENMTMFHYWEAIKERWRDPLKDNIGSERQWKKILDHYWYSASGYESGRKTCSLKLPETFWEDVEKLQNYMLKEIQHKGITIESNPSSNLMIGPFSKYSELPLFKFFPPGGGEVLRIPVTVNTDDKGIFATSLENEYSLVAIALRKQRDDKGNRRWNDKEIEDYLRQLALYGEMTRFKADSD